MGTLDFKDPLPIQVPRDMYDFHLQTYNFGNYETVTWVTGIILNSSPIELEQIRRLWDDKNGGILPEHASLGRHCQTVRNVDVRYPTADIRKFLFSTNDDFPHDPVLFRGRQGRLYVWQNPRALQTTVSTSRWLEYRGF